MNLSCAAEPPTAAGSNLLYSVSDLMNSETWLICADEVQLLLFRLNWYIYGSG